MRRVRWGRVERCGVDQRLGIADVAELPAASIASFGIASFGIASFGIASFGIASLGAASLGTGRDWPRFVFGRVFVDCSGRWFRLAGSLRLSWAPLIRLRHRTGRQVSRLLGSRECTCPRLGSSLDPRPRIELGDDPLDCGWISQLPRWTRRVHLDRRFRRGIGQALQQPGPSRDTDFKR